MPLRFLLLSFSCFFTFHAHAQEKPELTIERIMDDPKVSVGTSPSQVRWSEDSKVLYFDWNPEANPGDSLYRVEAREGSTPGKVSPQERRQLPQNGEYNAAYTEKVYSRNGNIYLYNIKTGREQAITQTSTDESAPVFSYDDKQVWYLSGDNLYAWEKASGKIQQLTDFQAGDEKEDKKSEREEQLEEEQLQLFQVLRERKEKRDASEAREKANSPKKPKTIYIGKKRVNGVRSNHNGRYITYTLLQHVEEQETDVPNYVTESGYTSPLKARPKVGSPQPVLEGWIYDTQRDSTYRIQTSGLPGLEDMPEYKKAYEADSSERVIFTHAPIWSEDGRKVLVTFRSADNKDRWITLLDPATGEVKPLDRQRDEAWVAGPGIGYSFSSGDIGWLPDHETIWFQSEESGYSHLYTLNTRNGEKTALTEGAFEVYEPRLSRDKRQFYFEANRDNPGIRQIYKMPVQGGALTQLTQVEGGYASYLSPDEKKIAFLFSTPTQPWDLYVMDNAPQAKPVRLTTSTTTTFEAYPWRTPEYVSIPAGDGATIEARLYRPENPETHGPAVVFVHGAGYLQNAHHWWSQYFREYMFHNLLVDQGYTVLDIDYRGSAGYGRDWRTGIYRFMGGKDLSDHVDGAKFLTAEYDVDPKRIGIYGGSYGGFITLMAMFTEPEVFAAGAGLRSVTDWAHYNHGYTSNILNTPVEDSVAFRKSAPIYHAEGLKGALLICHGMVDTNVHFQDVVRLVQRLIELKKENWELAVYPVEDHGFVEPSSWMDEYRRILKLFEENLK